jgi:hypothetical protein
MGGVLLRTPDDLLVDGVLDTTVDLDGDRLILLVADHDPMQNTLRHFQFSV